MMNDDQYQIHPISFYLWWIFCAFLVWPFSVLAIVILIMPIGFIVGTLLPSGALNIVGDWLLLPLLVLVCGLMIANVLGNLQRWLLRTKLYWAADGWRWLTNIGGVAGTAILGAIYLLIEITQGYYAAERWLFPLAMPIFMLFVSTTQWFALRNAVRDAWLWVLGNVVAAVVFSGMALNHRGYVPFFLALGAVFAQAVITGFVLHYLFEKKLLPMQVADDLVNPAEKTTQDNAPTSVWDEAI